MANRLTESLGQNVLVENRPGPGGLLAAQTVVGAEPDGHTLGCSGSSLPLFPLMYDLSFDPLTDLVPVATIVSQPLVLLVQEDSEIETVADLVEAAEQEPGSVTWGSAGIGGGTHLAGVLFAEAGGIDVLHVPYGGTAAALTDLLGGRITYLFNSPGTSLPHIEEGTLKALAVTTEERSPILPEVPTLDQAGVEDAEYRSWFGLFAPGGTPQEVIDTLSEAIGEVVQDPETQEVFTRIGVEGWYLSAEELGEFVAAETEKWRETTTAAGINLRNE